MNSGTFRVELELTNDSPTSLDFQDITEGLESPWYRMEITPEGGVDLCANQEGFEFFARLFLKLARGNKPLGYHTHQPMEFGLFSSGPPEFTIELIQSPPPPA